MASMAILSAIHKMKKELRANPGKVGIETRADGKEDIVGQAIVFNQLSQLLGGWFKEQIDPRALDECDMSDTCGLFNHNDDTILGRITAGTLTLEAREDGLYYRIPYDPSDPDHVRVRAKIMRGDVRGSSFAFMIAPGGADWDTDPTTGTEIRTVKKIAILADVSPVVNPAYLQTSAGLGQRSLDLAKEEHDQFLAEKRQTPIEESPQQKQEEPQLEESTIPNTDEAMRSVAAELDLMAMELEL